MGGDWDRVRVRIMVGHQHEVGALIHLSHMHITCAYTTHVMNANEVVPLACNCRHGGGMLSHHGASHVEIVASIVSHVHALDCTKGHTQRDRQNRT